MSRPPKRGIESLLSECCCLPSPSQSWQRSGTHTALMAKHHHSGKHPHKAELRASIHQPLLCTVTQEQGCKRKTVKKKTPKLKAQQNSRHMQLLIMKKKKPQASFLQVWSWCCWCQQGPSPWQEAGCFPGPLLKPHMARAEQRAASPLRRHRHSHFIANPERSENLVRSRSEAILVMLKAALLNSRKLTQKSGKVFRNLSRTEHHQETARQHLWTLLAWSSVQPLVFSFGHS